jgi:hypothetical protein
MCCEVCVLYSCTCVVVCCLVYYANSTVRNIFRVATVLLLLIIFIPAIILSGGETMVVWSPFRLRLLHKCWKELCFWRLLHWQCSQFILYQHTSSGKSVQKVKHNRLMETGRSDAFDAVKDNRYCHFRTFISGLH